MNSPYRNAFGGLSVSPTALPREARIDVLRTLAGRLQADPQRDVQWLGLCLSEWLQRGGPLDAVLGVRAEPGSHHTAQARVRQQEVDSLLLRLSVTVGGDGKALDVMRGTLQCPSSAEELVARLRTLRAPTSGEAIRRARKRASSPVR